jgi:NAD(P)-dependent dehydrogenase (short-subunit alcohol dehydrogenase family)
MSPESFDRVVGVNVKGTLMMSQLAAKQMLAQEDTCDVSVTRGARRGAIINISSISAYTSSVNRGEYCVSKAGISMLTRLFADRLASERIFVYEIRPGIIATDMTAGVTEKYDSFIADGGLPIARWGQPEDIGNAVSALLTDKFSYSTGEVINVDGGFHLRRL